jgi:DNA adenine methylase
MSTGNNSPIRYYGGKGHMKSRIIPLLPRNGVKVYAEPYAGGASVFFGVAPYPNEVLNDINGDVINLYRVIQCPTMFELLERRLSATLYSRAEFRLALETRADPNASQVDRAWATFVTQNQGFGGISYTDGHWGRGRLSRRGMAGTVSGWKGRLESLDRYHARLSRAQIDSIDAIRFVRYWDAPDTLFYLDPPYVHDTRTRGNKDVYAHECDDGHHAELVTTLLGIAGMAVVSGYAHEIYRPLALAGWGVVDVDTACHAAVRGRGSGLQGSGSALAKVPRKERIWMSPSCDRGGMFGMFGAGVKDTRDE